jgi:histidine ammonia-lyase
MKSPFELLELCPGEVDLPSLRGLYCGESTELRLDPLAYEGVRASCAVIAEIAASGRTVYGVNTGFGRLASTTIDRDHLADLQRNLVLSHSAGVGPALPDAVVRLVVALKIVSLARGCSGVRPVVIDALLALFNAGVLPVIPAQGSVGASGDLAPLAHLAAVLLGVGKVRVDGETLPAAVGLARAGLEPLELGPKEGLALLNGTQVSTALALAALFETEDAFAAAVVAGSLSLEAIKGSLKPFDPRIHAARGQVGQSEVAAVYRELLTGSRIVESHVDCKRVQDPYCIRCQPQVMGAVLDQIRHVARILEIEANAASDNPLVFSDDGEVISGGNFHAEPVAFAADILAFVATEIGSMSERRLAMLCDPALNGGLPAFLIREGGLNSGFMIAQVTAAALVSECKMLAHPASVDTIPTSANQEDHVSMATHGARRSLAIAENVAQVVGIEAMGACQGVEFHRPLKSTPELEAAFASVRARAAFMDADRYLHPDLVAMRGWVRDLDVPPAIKLLLPSLI